MKVFPEHRSILGKRLRLLLNSYLLSKYGHMCAFWYVFLKGYTALDDFAKQKLGFEKDLILIGNIVQDPFHLKMLSQGNSIQVYFIYMHGILM